MEIHGSSIILKHEAEGWKERGAHVRDADEKIDISVVKRNRKRAIDNDVKKLSQTRDTGVEAFIDERFELCEIRHIILYI